MMNITAKDMNQLITESYRKEADGVLHDIEARITECASSGLRFMMFDAKKDVNAPALEMIVNDLREAGFKVDVNQAKRLRIYWDA